MAEEDLKNMPSNEVTDVDIIPNQEPVAQIGDDE